MAAGIAIFIPFAITVHSTCAYSAARYLITSERFRLLDINIYAILWHAQIRLLGCLAACESLLILGYCTITKLRMLYVI
ncbi:uncharacterized protein F4817DRAFT_325626 [Daldinia loculata]|uniref:uncharacterized protein n=1 Tax=Daldinia loculata TaxID=103429 RepID=UPI0020C2BCB9|nr:uncharacterized protein F4817DRAFT_325626 [Daldinia loculata]KAI1651256.1 hypothetical protein F4817DRAFT_325626 [Daldinia loculata]